MLPSVLNGAQRCQVLTRLGRRCKNPCAYKSLHACAIHQPQHPRKVPKGINHWRYKNGERTKEAEADHRLSATILLTLRDIGDSIGMFHGGYTRGRKPNGYIKLDMNEPEQLISAILTVTRKKMQK